MEKSNRVPPVSPHPDIITPEEVAYWHTDEGRKQLRENRKKLLAWDEREYQEYQERKKLKTLMSLLLENVIGIDVVKRKLNAKTDTEVEKKIREVFPDFHLPAHI
jgi:hypothetical protein